MDILLLSSPRCGTNNLCFMLNNCDKIISQFELFHQKSSYMEINTLNQIASNIFPELISLSEEKKRNLIADYIKNNNSHLKIIELIKNIHKDKFILGKIFPYHISNDMILNELIYKSKIVIILCRNPIDAFISEMKAKKINNYFKVDTTNVKINFNINEYNIHKKIVNNWINKIINILKNAQKKYIIIDYDSFYSTNIEDQYSFLNDKILRNLNLKISNFNIYLDKQDKSQNYKEKINNYDDDILKFINDEKNNYQMYFDSIKKN